LDPSPQCHRGGFRQVVRERRRHHGQEVREVFDTLHINFCLLCDDSKAKDDKERESEKALRDVLGEAVAKVKAMLAHDGAITKRHAECKALQVAQAEAAKDPSSLFMPQ
jgi:hypothetical protein